MSALEALKPLAGSHAQAIAEAIGRVHNPALRAALLDHVCASLAGGMRPDKVAVAAQVAGGLLNLSDALQGEKVHRARREHLHRNGSPEGLA